jgi:uncharacterized membrane protein
MDQAMRSAKQPVAAVIVGPYGHPFHPMLVPVPIGAWIASLTFDIASLVVDDHAFLVKASLWLIGLGVLGALAAATVGFVDFLGLPPNTPVHRTAVIHLSLNLAVTGAFVANFAWRHSTGTGDVGAGQLVLSVLSIATLAASGFLGGKLTFHYGVRVADENTQAEGYLPRPTT